MKYFISHILYFSENP